MEINLRYKVEIKDLSSPIPDKYKNDFEEWLKYKVIYDGAGVHIDYYIIEEDDYSIAVTYKVEYELLENRTELIWHHRNDKEPDDGHRILVHSPAYKKDDPFRTRLIDSQFFKIAKDAKWWAYVNVPEE